MNPITVLALLDASISIVERAGPILAELRAKGEITPERQAELLARVNRWRAEDFSGPEWQVVP